MHEDTPSTPPPPVFLREKYPPGGCSGRDFWTFEPLLADGCILAFDDYVSSTEKATTVSDWVNRAITRGMVTDLGVYQWGTWFGVYRRPSSSLKLRLYRWSTPSVTKCRCTSSSSTCAAQPTSPSRHAGGGLDFKLRHYRMAKRFAGGRTSEGGTAAAESVKSTPAQRRQFNAV
jgi:hypothetical protein